MRKKVAIVYGGRSGEHEVSLRSAAAVLKHIDTSKYEIALIGIDKNGAWYLQDVLQEDVSQSLSVVTGPERRISLFPGSGLQIGGAKLETDLVLPLVHGTFGEDGALQGALELAGVPYAGSRVLGSALGMDKGVVKQLWERQGVPVVPYVILKWGAPAFPPFDDCARQFGTPLFIKPSCAGSSVGVSCVETGPEFNSAVEEAFQYDHTVLIEKGVLGREIECAVLEGEPPTVSSPGEIIPKKRFYDYEAKYIDPDGAELSIPANLSEEIENRIRALAAKVFTAAQTEGFARVDFFIERGTEKIFVNEINTIPGFTNISMFPLLFHHAGVSFSELIERIIESAMLRVERRRDLNYSYTPRTRSDYQ